MASRGCCSSGSPPAFDPTRHAVASAEIPFRIGLRPCRPGAAGRVWGATSAPRRCIGRRLNPSSTRLRALCNGRAALQVAGRRRRALCPLAVSLVTSTGSGAPLATASSLNCRVEALGQKNIEHTRFSCMRPVHNRT